MSQALIAKIDLGGVIAKGLAGEVSGYLEAGDFHIYAQMSEVRIRLQKLSRRKIITVFEHLAAMMGSGDNKVILRIELTVSPNYASGRLDSRDAGAAAFSDVSSFKAWDYPRGDVLYVPDAAVFIVQAT